MAQVNIKAPIILSSLCARVAQKGVDKRNVMGWGEGVLEDGGSGFAEINWSLRAQVGKDDAFTVQCV